MILSAQLLILKRNFRQFANQLELLSNELSGDSNLQIKLAPLFRGTLELDSNSIKSVPTTLVTSILTKTVFRINI